MQKTPIHSVVFDLGGVLVDWNPRHLYRSLFKGDDAAMEHFLTNIAHSDWNSRTDAGETYADIGAELKAQHPTHAEMIDAWFPGFNSMLKGPIAGTVEILKELHTAQTPLYALTNWSAETFHIARQRFDFLSLFKGIVVSGEEKCAKPDMRIFEILSDRYGLTPHMTLFIDDVRANIDAAATLGFQTIHFTAPEGLAARLCELELLPLKRCA